MIYTIPTDYCYDRYGDRWEWNKTDCYWQKNRSMLEEYAALNLLAQARGPLTDTPPITVGTPLDTVEKFEACPPGTVAHWPGMSCAVVKAEGGKWVRTRYESMFTSEVVASALPSYTVIYVPEEDQ